MQIAGGRQAAPGRYGVPSRGGRRDPDRSPRPDASDPTRAMGPGRNGARFCDRAPRAWATRESRVVRGWALREPPPNRSAAVERSPVRRGRVPRRVESARHLLPAASADAGPGPGAGAIAACHLGARARRVCRVVQAGMIRVAQALRFVCQVFLREPCLLQSALNGFKCNRNYAAHLPQLRCCFPGRFRLSFGT